LRLATLEQSALKGVDHILGIVGIKKLSMGDDPGSVIDKGD
jgi:hypothetical protein